MMRFKAWQRNVFGLLVAGTLVCSSVAWGAPLAGGLGIKNGSNTISDDDYEIIVNTAGVATSIDVGDVLLGAYGINGINGTASSVFDQELTVIYALEVTTVSAALPGAACLDFSAPVSATCASFTFGTIGSGGSGFADINAVLAAAGLGLPTYKSPLDDVSALPAGTIALVFVDPAKDFISPDITGTTFSALVASADGGQTLLAAALGVGSTGIGGVAPRSLIELSDPDATYGPGAGAGSIGVDFSVLQQTFPGFVITSSLVGISSIREPDATNPTLQNFGVRTDTTVSFNATVVPEPTTFLLFGSALVLLGGVQRLRRQRAQR